MALAPGGGLYGYGTFTVSDVALSDTPTPLLVDTGSVLSSRAIECDTPQHVRHQTLHLFDVPPMAGGAPAARADWVDVPVLETTISSIGIDGRTLALGGVLGGDLLQRFSVEVKAAEGGPSISLHTEDVDCSCTIADGCAASLNFRLAGGGSILFGTEEHIYPPTRVTLDVCLEPAADPLRRGIKCRVRDESGGPGQGRTNYAAGYETDQPPGADMRLLVATGFPGLLISANAWDRVHGYGAARALLDAGPFVNLQLPRDPKCAPSNSAGFRVVEIKLGDESGCSKAGGQPCASALALVGREGLLGACGELARSRRIRYAAGHPTDGDSGRHQGGGIDYGPTCDTSVGCPSAGTSTCLQCVDRTACGAPDRCNDLTQPAAAFVEIASGMSVYLTDDSAPILQEINNDVRYQISDVEGVIGTSLLARLSARIDYPSNRFVATCAPGDTGCAVYPRYACPNQVADCGRHGLESSRVCNPPSAIPTDGSICRPAPFVN